MRFHVFQIYYNEATRLSLEPGYLPLDNTKNERSDWYELWVIRNFLRNNPLSENDWYGFLSPHFKGKTGLTAQHVFRLLEVSKDSAQVALIPADWGQIAYFQNPFEQGDVWHPGITELSQSALRRLGHTGNLSNLVTYSGDFTFCNYVIAKPAYWREWLKLADGLFDLIENKATDLTENLKRATSYGSAFNQAPMKAFIQERLPAIILADRKFKTCSIYTSSAGPISDRLFTIDHSTRGVLQTCDLLKQRFCDTGDARFLGMFKDIRQLITLKVPSAAIPQRSAL